MSKRKITVISIVVAVVLVIAIACTAYCISTKQTPIEAVKTAFTSSDSQIIGKWESEKGQGISALVFYEDGTYDSYILTVNFSGEYTIKGNKLTLKNPKTNKEIVYKFSVNEKSLSLEVVEEDGKEPEQKDVSKYNRVDELHQKTFNDLIGDLAGDKNALNSNND